MTRRRRFSRALGGTDRGAVAVEAALITPLICLVVFGAVEFGFYFKEAHTTSSAATRGARELSALPKWDPYQTRVATLVSNALSVLNGDELNDQVQVVIYKADTRKHDEDGGPNVGDDTLPIGVSDVNKAFLCSQRCWHYTWDHTLNKLVTSEDNTSSSAWLTTDQWACAPDPSSTDAAIRAGRLDSAGVWIKVHFKPLTPLFGWLERDVITHAVFVLEPYPDTTTCVGSPDAAPPANN